jgi:hypothetical protein
MADPKKKHPSPLEMEDVLVLHGVRVDLVRRPSGEPFSAAPS